VDYLLHAKASFENSITKNIFAGKFSAGAILENE